MKGAWKRVLCGGVALLMPWIAQPEPHSGAPFDDPHVLPEYQLQRDTGLDARVLYQLTLDCWPVGIKHRAEISLEGRVGQRSGSWLDSTGYLQNTSPSSVALVARLPLFSATELEREHERQWQRRRRAAETVGHLVSLLADRQRLTQELGLIKMMESRARQRVLAGIVDSTEQVRYMERVADLDGQLLRMGGQVEKSKLELMGFCSPEHSEALEGYLKTHVQ